MTEPRFLGSFPRADHPLAPGLPEVALLGRSNVGKSSLLNALAGRRIAKISSTPGKTRMMNVFELHLHEPLPSPLSLYLLDLPGYGYSRASRADRAAFRGLITHVLDRPLLAGVLWLLDIRREPSDDDGAMQELFAARETSVLAALTKSDTVSRTVRAGRARALRETLRLDDDQMIVTSAKEREGIDELREAIAALIHPRTA